MVYEIRMGIPEMEKLWNELIQKHKEGTAVLSGKQEKWRYENVLGIWTRATTDYNYWFRAASRK